MYYGQFKQSLNSSDVLSSIRSFGHLIEMHRDGSVTIDRKSSEFESLEEARKYIKSKTFSEKLEVQISQEIYEEISEIRIANIIREHHDIKVTDTLIESYIDLASSKIFTLDPVVHEIRKLNKLDVVVEKLKKYHEITGNNAYKPSELLIKLAKNGEKFSEAPLEEERKEKLNFAMSSVAGNF